MARPLRITDYEITHLLRAEAYAVEMIARGDSALLELALQKMRRDRAALNPDDGDRNRKEDEHSERAEHGDPAPA